MKIDRNKLNTILRSGLNPEIKTRKQLAAHLSLDPTTLTRWFSSRDRLGNPRYPVVPDRHVTKILQLFKLDSQSLNLNDEEFRQYCFENSLSQSCHQSELEQKQKLRLEKASQRKLIISDYSTGRNKRPFFVIASIMMLSVLAWYFIKPFHFNNSKSLVSEDNKTGNELKCWTGYSPALGVFDVEDKADPCHYGKLFHNALMQLKAENNKLKFSKPLTERSASQQYISFLFQQLEYRRISDNISLNIELGKSELYRSNYQAAQAYFHNASEMLTTLPKPNLKMLTEISTYSAKIAHELQ
ncbi:hypothetical protein [Colwellia psychrerythraea]|uniref:hypothetical protein n=1 Tax=Colwellia psychrerythraea TaxID=28229 RepID=UPI0012377215|nr:hypothetical protein [Colwellia psychrerythraea]